MQHLQVSIAKAVLLGDGTEQPGDTWDAASLEHDWLA